MLGNLGQEGYILKNICIGLFCVLGHIDSNKHFQRIFYIFSIFGPNMLRIQGGEHCKQQNISVWPYVQFFFLSNSQSGA
jgi:hypothetical protein